MNSEGILFDGVYSFANALLSLISVRISRLIQDRDASRFEFGKYHFEPLFVFFRSSIFIIIGTYSFLDSFAVIIEGGNEIFPTGGLFYGVVSSVGCFLVWRFLVNKAKENTSSLLKLEAYQWKLDFYISFGLTVGFLIYSLLVVEGYPQAKYVDPVVVLFLSVFMLVEPIQFLRTSYRDVLFQSPADEIEKKVNKVGDFVVKFYGLKGKSVKIIRLGRIYYAEIKFLTDEEWKIDGIKKLDQIRAQIGKQLEEIDHEMLNISFTTRQDWV